MLHVSPLCPLSKAEIVCRVTPSLSANSSCEMFSFALNTDRLSHIFVINAIRCSSFRSILNIIHHHNKIQLYYTLCKNICQYVFIVNIFWVLLALTTCLIYSFYEFVMNWISSLARISFFIACSFHLWNLTNSYNNHVIKDVIIPW